MKRQAWKDDVMKLPDGLLENIRAKTPLLHFITNYVTVNDCANITLACGGSPIMADEASEVAQITSLCSALVLNIGTVNERTLSSMLRAGRHANTLGIPVVLDPAGAGASDFRNNAVKLLLKEVNFTIVRGNISEIKYLSHGVASTLGVDASAEDRITEDNLKDALRFAQNFSVATGSVIIISGPIDIITDSGSGYVLRNGHPMMSTVTGTGCMSGAVAGCFLGAGSARPLDAAVSATAAMGVCGELACEKLQRVGGGPATFRNLLIDSMSMLTDSVLRDRARLQQVF
mgnify:CR=1 FL=1